MLNDINCRVSRRSLLLGAAGLALASSLRPRPTRAEDRQEYRIAAAPARAALTGAQRPETDVWAYNGTVPGPTITADRGYEVVVNLTNRLPPLPLSASNPHLPRTLQETLARRWNSPSHR